MSDRVSVGRAVALKETDKALHVRLDDLGEDVWVPKSQVHDDSEVWKEGQSGDLVVKAWFAEQRGWS